jgi:predicted phosphodiesterase
MAFAVFTDIHGNLEALEAILRDIKKKGRKIKQTYFLGDAVTFGPDSSACLKLLQKYDVQCVVGNHEQRLFRYEKTVAEMTPAGIKHMEYIFRSLDNDDIRFIKSMPLELKIDYKGFRVQFSHYTHDENGVVLEDMDYFREDLLDKLFREKDCDAAFMGHLHQRKLYIRGTGRSYFCLDSSGCVKDNITHWTYFDIGSNQKNNFDIYRHDIKFDRAKFEKKMRELPIPEKERFAKKYFGIDFNNNLDEGRQNRVDLSIGDDK